jgi:phosphoglucosamine mutase
MTEPRFGTDGIRGVANTELSPQLALKLGLAAASVLAREGGRRRVVVGRDTRLSGPMLEAAIGAGFAAMGWQVTNVGVVPTPAVSQMTRLDGADAGVVLSASHNPYYDNGIKLFAADGRKLPDSVEDDIEAAMERWETLPRAEAAEIGRFAVDTTLVGEYIGQVKATMPVRLNGLKLVLDCANGATCGLAPGLFEDLGAHVTVIHNSPDGININHHCGSTHLASLKSKVVEVSADAGLAFDGDGDRVMMVDELGREVDGDRMMAICALGMKEAGTLTNNTVVATIMTNAGLEVALDQHQIQLLRTDVGDRYVAAEMERTGAAIGGEQSGHILLPRLSPTGDGMLTGLQVLARAVACGRRLSELADVMQSCPQRLVSIRVENRNGWKHIPEIQKAVEDARRRVGKPYWISVRASGTEPLIRIMVQDTNPEVVDTTVDELTEVVKRHCIS